MGKLVSLFLMVFLFVGIGNVWGQEKETITNPHLVMADSLVQVDSLEAAIAQYHLGMSELEMQKDWKSYSSTAIKLLKIYTRLSDLDRVIELENLALPIIRSAGEEAQKESYLLWKEFESIYYETYQPDRTIKLLHEGLTILQLINPNELRFDFGVIYNGLGSHYMAYENLDSALYYFEKSLYIAENSPDCERCKELEGNVLTNIGTTYRAKGNYGKSIDYIQRGIKISKEFYGEFNSSMISHYYSIASIYAALNEQELSIDYFKKAKYTIQLNKDNLPIFYVTGVIPGVNGLIGANYIELGNYEESKRYFTENINFHTKNPIKDQSAFVDYTLLSKVYYEQEEFEQAEQTLQKAMETLHFHPKHEENDSTQLLQILFLKYAGLYRKKKDYAKSIDYYKKDFNLSLTNRREISQASYADVAHLSLWNQQLDSALHYSNLSLALTGANTNEYTIPLLADLKKHQFVYQALRTRSDILTTLAEQQRAENSKKKLLSKSIALIELADSFHIENLKTINIKRANLSKTLINNSVAPYIGGIIAAELAYEIDKNPKYLDKAFYFMQKKKGQKLWLSQLNSEAGKFSNIDDAVLNEERDLSLEINYVEDLIFKAKKNGDIAAAEKLSNEKLLNLKETYSNFLHSLEKSNPDYYDSKYNFVPETTHSLQNLISNDDLIIEYVFSDSMLFTFTIAKNETPSLLKTPLDDQTMQLIQTYTSTLKNSTLARPASREKFINLSHQLYQQFLQPIENQLADKKRLIIIGDGMTNYIPFETLLASNEVKPFKDLDFLIKNHEISYHYSSTLFAKAKRKEQTTNSGIYAFAPVYDSGNKVSFSADATRSIQMDSTLRAFDLDGNYTPLPESEKEVNSIVQLFNNKSKNTTNTLALRANANEQNLKMNLEKPYQFVHIAGHSFADLDNPKFSGIACFKEENRDSTALSEDGTLFTGEIYNISSKADLVTLSSCESGFGKLEKTEGLLGLNRAFIYAGTPNVVFSLWKVYDKVSANLMVDFYENVLEGKDYSASLREAKLKLLEKEATAAPHFWSPFLLIGR